MTEEGTQAVALVIYIPELPCKRRPNTTRVVLTLTLVSMLADNNRWPLRGNNRIADTALLCPVQVWMHFSGRYAFGGAEPSDGLSLTSVSVGMCMYVRPA